MSQSELRERSVWGQMLHASRADGYVAGAWAITGAHIPTTVDTQSKSTPKDAPFPESAVLNKSIGIRYLSRIREATLHQRPADKSSRRRQRLSPSSLASRPHSTPVRAPSWLSSIPRTSQSDPPT